jgi:hypothetical protein
MSWKKQASRKLRQMPLPWAAGSPEEMKELAKKGFFLLGGNCGTENKVDLKKKAG